MSHIIQSNLTTIMWRQFFRLRKNKKKNRFTPNNLCTLSVRYVRMTFMWSNDKMHLLKCSGNNIDDSKDDH